MRPSPRRSNPGSGSAGPSFSTTTRSPRRPGPPAFQQSRHCRTFRTVHRRPGTVQRFLGTHRCPRAAATVPAGTGPPETTGDAGRPPARDVPGLPRGHAALRRQRPGCGPFGHALRRCRRDRCGSDLYAGPPVKRTRKEPPAFQCESSSFPGPHSRFYPQRPVLIGNPSPSHSLLVALTRFAFAPC
jgi:hypothetical protein